MVVILRGGAPIPAGPSLDWDASDLVGRWVADDQGTLGRVVDRDRHPPPGDDALLIDFGDEEVTVLRAEGAGLRPVDPDTAAIAAWLHLRSDAAPGTPCAAPREPHTGA